jgi:pyruvate formate lyase activating enzyme
MSKPVLISRRRFLRQTAASGVLLGGAGLAATPAWRLVADLLGPTAAGAAPAGIPLAELLRTAPVARYWTATSEPQASCTTCHEPADLARRGVPEYGPGARHPHAVTHAKCLLCARGCVLAAGERGECGARIFHDGALRSLVYGRPVAVHVDPIEKKPFYHVLPGAIAYSLSTAGCPLHCQFCQNWELSQARPEDHRVPFVPPGEVAAAAAARKAPLISFTYNEPTVFTEYLVDIAQAARANGVRSVLVSCGFMNAAPLAEMCEVLAAIKIDLKGFSPEFYRRVSRAELDPVLASIKAVARSGRHLEIVNLVVPTLNDAEPMLEGLADWVMGEIGPDVPLHFTRFHPDYKLLNLPPTPVATLELAHGIARDRGLHYVYIGNVPGHPANNTYCPGCGRLVIGRQGFFVTEVNLSAGKCAACGTKIAGVWT